MRTTLDIDSDVLAAAKEMGRLTRRSAGAVLSDLARLSLVQKGPVATPRPTVVNGFEILPAANRVVTPELVQKLTEESDQP